MFPPLPINFTPAPQGLFDDYVVERIISYTTINEYANLCMTTKAFQSAIDRVLRKDLYPHRSDLELATRNNDPLQAISLSKGKDLAQFNYKHTPVIRSIFRNLKTRLLDGLVISEFAVVAVRLVQNSKKLEISVEDYLSIYLNPEFWRASKNESLFNKFKDDKNVFLLIVEVEGSNLSYASEKLRDDKELVEMALKSQQLQYQSRQTELKNFKNRKIENLKNDSLLVSEMRWDFRVLTRCIAASEKKIKTALKDASKKLQDDEDLVLLAIESNGMALKYASERLRDKKKVVLAALGRNGEALEHASDRLKANKNIVLVALGNTPKAFGLFSDLLNEDPDVVSCLEKWYTDE